LDDRANPIASGEKFLEEEADIRTYVPGFGRPYYIALVAKIVGILGSGKFLFKAGFDTQTGITDKEVEYLQKRRFDEYLAKGLIQVALYRAKLLETQTMGIDHQDFHSHLAEAKKMFESSQASESIVWQPKFVLEILSNEKPDTGR
jgi:hypothetical protein